MRLSETYLREIAQHELLTADEELALARRIETGRGARAELDASPDGVSPERRDELAQVVRDGLAARARLIECNLRLVVSVAARYGELPGLPLIDLVQEGNIGLHLGVEKFDWRRGFRFSTYAYWWIRQAVTRAIADKARTIRLPVHATELLARAKRVERELAIELQRQPTLDEQAQRLRVNLDWLREVRRAAQLPLSLETPLGGDGDLTRADLIGDDRAAEAPRASAEAADLAGRLTRALDELTARERLVLRMRFGLDGEPERTLDEVARELGVSRERIRQVELAALARLRRMPHVLDELAEYVP